MTEAIRIVLNDCVGRLDLKLDLDLPMSGWIGLSGPSGVGKTTLLKSIAGHVRLKGTIVLGETVFQDDSHFLPPHLRRVAMVFQKPALFPHLNVRENLNFGRKRLKSPSLAWDAIMARFGLEPLLSRSVTHLSGGEAQRVALAQAILSEPRLILMDEPLSSLDGEAKTHLLSVLKSIRDDLGVMGIYVSHDPHELIQMTPSQIYMRQGRVISKPQDTNALTTLDGLSDQDIRALALKALNQL